MNKYINGWLALVCLVGIIVSEYFFIGFDIVILKFLGIITLFIASIFSFLPFIHLKKYGNAEKDYFNTKGIVNKGIYSFVRHPQYLGYMLYLLGFILIRQNFAAISLGVLGNTFLYFMTVKEEKACIAKFGDEYLVYKKQTPRFNFVIGILKLF